jgi:hypothetical protein
LTACVGASGILGTLADDGKVAAVALDETSLALTADGGGMNADSRADGPKGKTLREQVIHDEAVSLGEMGIVWSHGAAPYADSGVALRD